MHRNASTLLVLGFLAVMGAGCGGDDGGGGGGPAGPGPGTGGSGPMSARIDGALWEADDLPAGLGVMLLTPGLYYMEGHKVLGGTNVQILTLTLTNIRGIGTYPLGVSVSLYGGTGAYGDANAIWSTPLSGAAGSVTITTLSTTRIAGTFEFTATPATGSATGTRTVTAGRFDYPIYSSGTVGPVPANAGGGVAVKLNGQLWTAATGSAVQSSTGTPFMVAGGLNTLGSVNLTVTLLTGPAVYPLRNTSPQVTINVRDEASGHTWGGNVALGPGGTSVVTLDQGSIEVTSLTTTRVQGTFSGRLAPAPGSAATDTLTVTEGSFDLGLPQLSAGAAAPR